MPAPPSTATEDFARMALGNSGEATALQIKLQMEQGDLYDHLQGFIIQAEAQGLTLEQAIMRAAAFVYHCRRFEEKRP